MKKACWANLASGECDAGLKKFQGGFPPILKFLLNLLQYCFCSVFCFFGHEACGILALQPGMEPVPPALEGEVLTAGP